MPMVVTKILMLLLLFSYTLHHYQPQPSIVFALLFPWSTRECYALPPSTHPYAGLPLPTPDRPLHFLVTLRDFLSAHRSPTSRAMSRRLPLNKNYLGCTYPDFRTDFLHFLPVSIFCDINKRKR